MNSNITKIILVTAGAVLYNLLFWSEKLGVNTILYDLFILTALFSLYPKALANVSVRWLILAHLLCAAMVVFHNTAISKLAFTVTLCLIAAFAEYVHRSAWYAGGSMLMNVVFMVASFVESAMYVKTPGIRRKPIARFIRFAVFPLALLVVFFAIYSSANEAFSKLADQFLQQIELFFINFFDPFSFQRFLFFILGLFITGSLLLKSKINFFSRKEAACSDELHRKRISWRLRKQQAFYQLVASIMGRFAKGTLALKNENTTAIISLVSLNALLLFVNIIDIQYLWFNFEYKANEPVYKMVHEGTELLITSIVLAMAILLFFFNGNLNFYRRNKWLKYGAYLWILQNIVLVVSVCIRDYYYIERQGLAYKRIGVLFFLLMVLIGLLTVFIKIAGKKSNYYLFRVNAWAGIVVLVLATTIHWDELIAGYNLQRKETVAVDVPFLLSLDDKALPLLEKNKELLAKAEQEHQSGVPARVCVHCYTEQFQKRKTEFLDKQKKFSWLSWNYSDAYTHQILLGVVNHSEIKKQ